MRFKGRYINELAVVNVPKEPIVEIQRDNGIRELRPGIDVISIFPVRRRRVSKNHDLLILVSIIISAFLAGASFIGMFFFFPYVCGFIFVFSLAWTAFILWVNRND